MPKYYKIRQKLWLTTFVIFVYYVKNLTKEYVVRYKKVLSPGFCLFLPIISKIMNIIKSAMDSYKKLGITSLYIPFSIMPILKKLVVSVPYASIFIKLPHLPIACPNAKQGAIISSICNMFSFLILQYTIVVIVPPIIPPYIASPPDFILNISNGYNLDIGIQHNIIVQILLKSVLNKQINL